MPTTRSTYNLQTGVPVGPGKLSLPEYTPAGVTGRYEMGELEADRAFNGDGLHLTAEARMRAGRTGEGSLDRVDMAAGVEGIEARFRVVKDGQGKLDFNGLRLKDGYFKGKLNEGRDWLEERPMVAGAAAVGVVVAAHAVAKRTGPIDFDTGGMKLYEKDGFKASVTGYMAVTGDDKWIDARGAKLKLGYTDASVGEMAIEGRFDRKDGPSAKATWRKRSGGLDMYAEARYEPKHDGASAWMGLSYCW